MNDTNRWHLEGCVERLLAFRDSREWKPFHTPKDLAAALAIEAAELQEVFLWKPSVSAETVQSDADLTQRTREELADCAIYILLMAHDLGIDLRAAVEEKIAANDKRYSIEQHRGRAWKAPHKDYKGNA